MASKLLKNDKDVVMKAVTQNGNSLGWASEQLKKNKEVVMQALTQNGESIKWT